MKIWVRVFHLFFALVPICTIAYDLAQGNYNILNYFSLFTILSNVLASFVFLYLVLVENENKNNLIDSIRGATTAYLLISAIVYFLLLKDIPSTALPWVNTVLHQIMPAVFTLDWLILPPRNNLNLSESFKWLVPPVLYLGYVVSRGSIVNWYPYPFLDPVNNGYVSVFFYSVVIAMAGLLLSTFLIVLGNKFRDLGQVR